MQDLQGVLKRWTGFLVRDCRCLFFGPSVLFLDARSVSSRLWRARDGVSLDRLSTTVTKVVEGCVYVRRDFFCIFSHERRASALRFLLLLPSLSCNTQQNIYRGFEYHRLHISALFREQEKENNVFASERAGDVNG